MVRNLLKRKIASGWMLETSTMYGAGEGSVAEGTHAYAKKLGKTRGALALLFDHRQASEKWDLAKRKERLAALAEAYGPAAEWMNLEAIADSYDDPQTNRAEWVRYWLNQPVPMIAPPDVIMPQWPGCAAPEIPMPEGVTIGLGGSLDGLHANIGAAGMTDDGHLIVGAAMDPRPGVRWVIEESARIQSERGCDIVIDRKGPLEHLIPDLEEAGVRLTLLDMTDWCDASEKFWQMVKDGKDGALRHANHPALNAQVKAAKWRAIGNRRAFERKVDDSSLLEGCALAAYQAQLAPSGFNIW